MPADADLSIVNHAGMLLELTDALGLGRFHLVGHDVGGGIAQIFAVKNQGRLLSLTLVNSVAYDFWPVQPIITLRTPIIRQLAMATIDLGALRQILKLAFYRKELLTEELVNSFAAPISSRKGRRSFLNFARALDNNHLLEIADRLKRLDVPVLVIRGDADPFLTSAIVEKLVRELPHCRLERIDTASHYIMYDEPEWLAEKLMAFFDGAGDVRA
jgi:pimeloyl-ACP methyl ester carboxylesterase